MEKAKANNPDFFRHLHREYPMPLEFVNRYLNITFPAIMKTVGDCGALRTSFTMYLSAEVGKLVFPGKCVSYL